MDPVLEDLSPGDEYLVINGGSTDGSVDIIRQHDQHLSGWVNEPDRGYANSLTKGFKRVSVDIVCWTNPGDLRLPDPLFAMTFRSRKTAQWSRLAVALRAICTKPRFTAAGLRSRMLQFGGESPFMCLSPRKNGSRVV